MLYSPDTGGKSRFWGGAFLVQLEPAGITLIIKCLCILTKERGQPTRGQGNIPKLLGGTCAK